MNELLIRPIAYIRTDFPDKFGIPRQGGVIDMLKGRIFFEKEYNDRNYVREIEQYSHLWLIWGFSKNFDREAKHSTVRPPVLGGNERVGVFASRSPFRPNPLALSAVKLEGAEYTKKGPVLIVSGIDMADMTPIYDIKPYLKYTDAITDANDGFSYATKEALLKVDFCGNDRALDPEIIRTLSFILSNDPRPHYQADPTRIYNMTYAGYNISFRVENKTVYVLKII